MKLQSLTFENFRQFYGMQTIDFSGTEERNVTVVYGANGSGKTTVLNAFTWALYKTFTPDFEEPDHLINERKWAEAATGTDVNARVVVVFEHEDRYYTVERATTRTKDGETPLGRLIKDGQVKLTIINEEGTANTVQNPTDVLNQILPERLHRFFFFNGERIENVVKPRAYTEIENAIKSLLGLEIVERSMKHLQEARKRLELDSRLVGSPELGKITDRLQELRTRLEAKQKDIESVRLNRDAIEGELDAVDEKMRSLEDARQLQEKREQLESDLEANKTSIIDVRKGIANLITSTGYLAFLGEPAKRAVALLEESRQRGEIPTPIKRQFVEDLLESGKCICGSALVEGEEAHAHVAAWRGRAGSAHIEQLGTELAAQAKFMQDSRASFFEALEDREKQLVQLKGQSRSLEEQLSEIHRQLGGKQSEEIQKLEDRRNQLRAQFDQYNIKLGGLIKEEHDIEEEIVHAEKEFAGAKADSARAVVAQRRVQVAAEARDIFSKVLKLRTQDVRSQLDRRIKKIYGKISFKPYAPVLTEKFHLELRKEMGQGELVPKSTGENQILSLAFVGALAELARDRFNEVMKEGKADSSLLSFRGGIYPIVMDSAFGNLDENYQSQVARSMPVLAPQVSMFVSKAQGQGAVEAELVNKVAKRYVLHYFTPKEEFSPETIEIEGASYPYISKTSDDAEWVELVEV